MRTTKIRRRITTIGATVALVAIPIAALAGNVFNDVDDNSPHIEGITWVKDSGVSVGCDSNGNYCPEDDVTRAQMGTFMYRLSGNDPATAPSVNADKLDGISAEDFLGATDVAADSDLLDGKDSAEILPIMFGQRDSTSTATTVINGGLVEISNRLFAVPADGYLVISGTVQVDNNGPENAFWLSPIVDNAPTLFPSWAARQIAAADGTGVGEMFTMSYTVVVPITQGIHTVTQTVGPASTTDDFAYNQQNLVVVFYPEDQGFINNN